MEKKKLRAKFPVKRLVMKHEFEIAAWRENEIPWCEITATLAEENGKSDLREDSIRKAWLTYCPKYLKKSKDTSGNVQKNSEQIPVSPVIAGSYEKTPRQILAIKESLRILEKSEDRFRNNQIDSENAPASPASKGIQQPTERLSEHEAACRAALTRGNKSDAELGIN